MPSNQHVEQMPTFPDLQAAAHHAGEDTIILGGSLVITRAEVEAGFWAASLIQAKADNLAASFRAALEREIAVKGWKVKG